MINSTSKLPSNSRSIQGSSGREIIFFPSALCHVPEADDSYSESSLESPEPQANQPSPFLVAFETGFCPRGIAGALIKCLMTNEIKSSREWELLPEKNIQK